MSHAMDMERFRAMVEDPRRTKDDLVTIRENVVHGNALGHLRVVEATLDQRLPGWRRTRTRRGGPDATDVEFKGRMAHFDTQKGAYIWLLERFVQHYPKPFVEVNRDTVCLATGPRSLYFARSLARLFGEGHEDLAADANKWCRLTNGWYAKLVLNEAQKLERLRKFAAVAHLRFGVDWDWNGEGRANPEPSTDDTDELLRGFLVSAE